MKEEFFVIREHVEEFITSSFISNLNKEIDEQILFIGSVKDLIKTHLLELTDLTRDELKFYKEIEKYNTGLLSLLQEKSNDKTIPDFKEKFSGLVENYDKFLKSNDEIRIENQDDERFKILDGDSILIKGLKVFKKTGYFVTILPGQVSNTVKKWFHKSGKPLKIWKRKIYFRNLLQLIVKYKLLLNSFNFINELSRDSAIAYQAIWIAEERINKHFTADLHFPDLNRYSPDENQSNLVDEEFDSVTKLLQKSKDNVKQKTGEIIEAIFKEFDDLYNKAGTLEYPARRYSNSKVEKTEQDILKQYKQISSGWGNTFFTLFEDWKLNKDIYINEILQVQDLFHLKEESKNKIIGKIISEIDEIKREVLSSKTRIEEQRSTTGLREILLREKSTLYKNLSIDLINKAAELLLGEEIPATVDKLEINLRRNIQRTLTKRAIVRIKVYDREIRASEIEYIEPLELIRFEILPDFLNEMQKLKALIVEQVDDIQKNILNIDQIADFNLESAIAAIDSAENDNDKNDPGFVAIEGLERAASKTDEIKSQLHSVYETIVNSSSDSLGHFNKRILDLTDTDNITEIRLRIAKAKTIEKTKQFRTKSVQSVKYFIPIILNLLKRFFLETGGLYKNFRKRFGLEKHKVKISTEISDFLTETENAINKLPYVYQRLFKIEPLEDEKFYEHRPDELNALRHAYDNWKAGHYAPAVLVGEKGSGVTTTINFFLKNDTLRDELIRSDIDQTITNEEGIIKYFGNLFRMNLRDMNDVINAFNTTENKRIIILENIQHLYLRKIGGFKALKLLFEVMSATSRNVFWLLTSNLYAWQYLERVLNISDYFAYTVKLNPLTDEQIVDIILKRHRVSGYNILFYGSPDDLQNKTFQKLTIMQQQASLKERYFSELNRFAKSNLSISLFFWMRSTREVENNTITIGSLEGLDFSFLQAISDEKIFTLYSILIHDGLTIEQHSIIFNQDPAKSRLILLLLADDGIVIKRKENYNINPLLYRQIVSLLQTKNILH